MKQHFIFLLVLASMNTNGIVRAQETEVEEGIYWLDCYCDDEGKPIMKKHDTDERHYKQIFESPIFSSNLRMADIKLYKSPGNEIGFVLYRDSFLYESNAMQNDFTAVRIFDITDTSFKLRKYHPEAFLDFPKKSWVTEIWKKNSEWNQPDIYKSDSILLENNINFPLLFEVTLADGWLRPVKNIRDNIEIPLPNIFYFYDFSTWIDRESLVFEVPYKKVFGGWKRGQELSDDILKFDDKIIFIKDIEHFDPSGDINHLDIIQLYNDGTVTHERWESFQKPLLEK